MVETPIRTLDEFLSQPMWDTRRMIYRGVSNSSFELIPSVGRLQSLSPQGLLDFERDVLADFRRRALPFLSRPPEGELEWMFLAQHYGLPTRLLDWTTNPLVALYFACNAPVEADFAVYVTLHPEWLAELGVNSPWEIDRVLGVTPPHADVRFVAQKGLFTIHPQPLDAYRPPFCIKYVFEKTSRADFKWKLRKLGFSASRLFPGLDGVAKDVFDDNDIHLRSNSIRGSLVYPGMT